MLQEDSDSKQVGLNRFENIVKRVQRVTFRPVDVLAHLVGKCFDIVKNLVDYPLLDGRVIHARSNRERLLACRQQQFLRSKSDADALSRWAIATPLAEQIPVGGETRYVKHVSSREPIGHPFRKLFK